MINETTVPIGKIGNHEIFKRSTINGGLTRVEAMEPLGWLNNGKLRVFRPNSVVSFALVRGACPVQAADECRKNAEKDPERGHVLHWIHEVDDRVKPELTKVLQVQPDMKLLFEGRVFILRLGDGNPMLDEQ